MPIFPLEDDPEFADLFPPVGLAEENGLLAIGGDLTPKRLIAAYRQGIFPWFSQDEPLLWWSPDPRLILRPEKLHLSRSLKKTLRRETYRITYDHAFEQVITACAETPRGDNNGTWIVPEMVEAYCQLQAMGYAHSAEAWRMGIDGSKELVGGAYGVAIGGAFFGESMFYLAPDASKVAFASLVQRLNDHGFTLIDCQMDTDHLRRFGAELVTRETFLGQLKTALSIPVEQLSWRQDGAI
ncbi:MAG: leucyl/phenylalanyl-tRNA--protein transferase [Magnetococcales bacterium]|nr:leucyl/phenylalanyl-tRNA--protein transferase [Magnetococcales bacterium]